MDYEIVELDYSGSHATIYTLYNHTTSTTLYGDFVQNNIQNFKDEIIDIDSTINLIGKKKGSCRAFN